MSRDFGKQLCTAKHCHIDDMPKWEWLQVAVMSWDVASTFLMMSCRVKNDSVNGDEIVSWLLNVSMSHV